MSTSVDIAFVQQFNANVLHLAQQKGSRLRDKVRVKTDIVGKSSHFERLASGSMFKRTSRHQDTQIGNLAHSRRRVTLDDYERGELIDEEDDFKMLIDPDNEYAIALGNAAGRQIDDVIITAATAASTNVAADDTTSTTALPSTQMITAGGTGLTLAKIISAAKILNQADVPDEDRVFVYNGASLEDLLNDSTITSADYNTVRLLMQGAVDTFMGFSWVRSERLITDGTNRQNLAYHRNAIGLAIGKEVSTAFDKRPDKSNAMQVLVKLSIGAVRIEETPVVSIKVVE